MKPSTLIVGYGITGKNLHREIAAIVKVNRNTLARFIKERQL